jgi:hypothetical protein
MKNLGKPWENKDRRAPIQVVNAHAQTIEQRTTKVRRMAEQSAPELVRRSHDENANLSVVELQTSREV